MTEPDYVDYAEQKAVLQSRRNFWVYRQFINYDLITGWYHRLLAHRLQKFYDDFVSGLKPKLVIQTPPQHGKLLADNTPVLTPQGWKQHGEIKQGDYVYSPSGRAIKVLAVSDKAEANYKVTLGNGESFYCHARHEWTVIKHSGQQVTKETAELLEDGLITGTQGKRGSRYKYHLPKVKPLDNPDKILPVDPYVLGVWLGNGTQTKAYISYAKKDNAVIQEVNRRGYPVIKEYTHKTTGVITGVIGNLKDGLKQAGVFADKYGIRKKTIPECYLTASIKQRLDLLAGLIDTDGYYCPKTKRIVFVTLDNDLKDAFITLISTFGCNHSLVTEAPKTSTSGIHGRRQVHYIGFTPDFAIPCILERKRNTPVVNKRHIAIIAIEKTNQEFAGHCLTVDSQDGLYLAGRTLQPTHNSEAVTDFILWAIGHNPNLKIIYTSFSDRLGVRANLKVQRVLDSERYRKIFPSTKIAGNGLKSDSTRNRQLLEFDGSTGYFRNTTVGGAITGETLDIGVIDDPIKGREEANSQTIRDKTWDWLLDDFMTRFSENAGMLCILTRWHPDDPIGRLLEHLPEIDVFSYPAIATQDEEYRKKGEALFPELKSLDFLLERKAAMYAPYWEALYQQNPVLAEGNVFKPEQIQIIDALPAGRPAWVRGWDLASTTDGDWTAGVKIGRYPDGKLVIADVVHLRVSPDARDYAIVNTASQDGRLCRISIPQDPGQAGKTQVLYLARSLQGYRLRTSPESGSKEVRAMPIAAQVNVGNVSMLRGPWNREFLEELRAFPNGAHDDMVDALSRAFAEIVTGQQGLNIK